MSAAKAPPRRATSAKTRVGKATEQDTRTVTQKRAEGLMDLAQLGQGICLLMGQYADAAAIGTLFSPVASELANVTENHEILAKPIYFMIEVGPYGALIAASMPFVMQIAANHKLINAGMLA